jgi:hypothetical protein
VMPTQPNTGLVFCISFLEFSYENILILCDSKVGSYLYFLLRPSKEKCVLH